MASGTPPRKLFTLWWSGDHDQFIVSFPARLADMVDIEEEEYFDEYSEAKDYVDEVMAKIIAAMLR